MSTGEIQVLTDSTEIILPSAVAAYSVQMGIFSDASFSQNADPSEPITVPDLIFVGIQVDNIGENSILAQQCWATPS